MRALLFTPGSPFARAVRVVLDELGLDYEQHEQTGWESAEERLRFTPTLQVPAFWDGEIVLWDSEVICEYLLATYPRTVEGTPPLSPAVARPGHEWQDRLVMATIRTLGISVATVSQLTWTGVTPDSNGHARRCADRLPPVLDWLERRLDNDQQGFLPGWLSLQDVFLACILRFAQNRPLQLDVGLEAFPRIASLLHRLDRRPSFEANPISWWAPEAP